MEMSASPEGSASPMSPRRSIEDFPRQSISISEDPSVLVERKITDLAEQLTVCITELSKDKQITNKKMEEIATAMKKSLADIESGLHEQLNLMEESLMSGDFNCCPPLNEHQIDTVDEMACALRMHLNNALPKRKPLDEDDIDDIQDGISDIDMDSEGLEDTEGRYSPRLMMDPALAEQSILRTKGGKSLSQKIDDNVKFSKKVHKRLYHDSDEEDLEKRQEEATEKFARLPSRAKMIQSLMGSEPTEEDLNLRETLYRAEGLSLLGQELREDEEEREDLDPYPLSPMSDEARKLEKQISDLKKDYQHSKSFYEEQLEILEPKREEDKKYLDTLKSEVKTKKVLLKNMLEKRNLARGFTVEDLEKRKEEKLMRKIAMLEKTGTLENEKSTSDIDEDPELFSSSSDEDASSKGRRPEHLGTQGESSKKKTTE